MPTTPKINPVAVERLAPVGQRLGGEHLVENRDQFRRMTMPGNLGLEARIGQQVLALDHLANTGNCFSSLSRDRMIQRSSAHL